MEFPFRWPQSFVGRSFLIPAIASSVFNHDNTIMTFENILASTLTVFLMVAAGMVVRRLKLIDQSSEHSMMSLVVWLIYPCFILSRVPGNEALRQGSIVTVAILAGFTAVVVSLLICYGVGRLLNVTSAAGLSTFALATAIQNFGFIPIPLVEAIFPAEQGNEIMGVLVVHNLGVDIAMWTVGIVVLSGSSTGAWRRLVNGPSIAIVLGLMLNFSGLHTQIPGVLVSAMETIGRCTIPMSLILVGATLMGVIEKAKFRPSPKVIGTSLVLRMGLLPLMLVAAALLVGHWFDARELQIVLLIQAAMPGAIFPIVLARHYGGKPEIAVQTGLATSAASLLLTPLLLQLWLSLIE